MAGTQVVTILFCDLVSSTERRARIGDDAFDEFNRRMFVVWRNAIAAHGGREVSNAGDGMMVVFPHSAADAVTCAMQMQQETAGLCSYELYTIDPGRTLSSQTVPELSGLDDGSLKRECAAWPVHKLDERAFADPSTIVPTLVVSGDLSPTADQAWPEEFQQKLPNATVVHFPTMNENLLNQDVPRCLADLRRRFLTDPRAPLDAAGCSRQSPPIHFVASPTP